MGVNEVWVYRELDEEGNDTGEWVAATDEDDNDDWVDVKIDITDFDPSSQWQIAKYVEGRVEDTYEMTPKMTKPKLRKRKGRKMKNGLWYKMPMPRRVQQFKATFQQLQRFNPATLEYVAQLM